MDMAILVFSGEDFSLGGPPLQEVKANIGSNASLRCEATIKFADCTFRATSGEVRTIPTDCGRREREEKHSEGVSWGEEGESMWNHCQGLGGRRCRGVEVRWRKNRHFTQALYYSCIMQFIIRGKNYNNNKKYPKDLSI